MKKLMLKSVSTLFNLKLLQLTILILIGVSCAKEKVQMAEFEFKTIEIISYPSKQISMTFDIVPQSNIESYAIKWFNPDTLNERGPYTINFSNDIILDYEVTDNTNSTQRNQYIIKTDTIDSLKYDFRNTYIGIYYCNATYTYGDSTNYYQDTLTVIKNNSFNKLNILTPYDILNNYDGNKMTYLNSSGYNNYPTGDFYGYHSGVSFSNDSIYYTVSGSLGFYYTIKYVGLRITN
ncbi:MAG: hypothetical protein Q8T08_24455 [Ignavibacteria bacterium]|nr:hypothetical protein [Ignavibacteria bacterium]